MKLKKLAAGLLAAVVAVTSIGITTSVIAATPNGTETTLGTFTNTEFVLYGDGGSDGEGTNAWNCQWVQLSQNDQSWTWADVLAADNTYLNVTYSMDETTVGNHNNGQWGVGDWYTGDIKVSKDPAVPFYADGWTLVSDTDYSAYVPVADLGFTSANVDEWGQIGFNLQANMGGTFTVSSVTLVEFDIYPTTIEISGDTTVTVGEDITLTAEVTNDNGDEITTDTTVTWSVDKSDIATVDEDGVVTGVASGTATVTASVAGENSTITDTYEVTVTAPAVYVTAISIPETLALEVDETSILTATLTPETPDDDSITWSSSDTSIATVDANGKVTAVAAGTATITATADGADPDSASVVSDTCTVTVTAPTAEESLESGSYGDGTYQELSADDIANISFSTDLNMAYSTTADATHAQFTNNGNASIYRFYKLVKEADLANMTSASIVIKHTNGKAFELTSSKAYRKLSADQTAPEGYVYLAFVIDSAPEASYDAVTSKYYCDLSWSDITLS